MTNRRKFLRNALSIAVGGATFGLTACGTKIGDQPQTPIPFEPGKPLPWINWAGNQSCIPKKRVSPSTDDEVLEVLKNATGTIRPVGSAHSFSPVVPTDDTLLCTDLLSGVIQHYPDKLQSEIWSGTRMHNLGPMLDSIGQALPNMPDMDYPSMGGAIANSVHGTGISFGSMSDYVVGLSLATPSGDLIECDRTNNSEIFHAARTNIGSLGLVTRMTIQNVAPFDVTEVNGVADLEDVLEDLDNIFSRHRHFELYALPYTDKCLTVTTDIAKVGDVNVGEDDPEGLNVLREVFDSVAWVPGFGPELYEQALISGLGDDAGEVIRTGKSYQVLPHARMVRFREMEYSVPVEFGPQCLRDILSTIKNKKLPMCFPIEYRHVKADDIWLSMYEGQTAAAISIHQFGDLEYKAAFAEIEQVFWKYNGRPHWGKLHTLDAKRLANLYPHHWQDFQEVRSTLDPSGKMLNDHLRELFIG
ncbi:MAG: FAD-linked oxidoreductase [Flavobacterium sp.]|jgi:FAD-linked oxidoreductase